MQLEQTGDYITWPTAHQPDADGLVTIPVNFAARSLTATLTLETVDDQMSEDNGSVTAAILADADGSYVKGAGSGHTTRLLDNDLPVISVAAVSAEVTEGTDAQFRFNRMGNTSGATRVGLWVGGLPKIMTDATEAIALTADNADLSQRLHIHGAWVDYILEFAAGEAEKTLSFTTEADNVNEGDGWLGVTIVQRAGNPFGIGTGYAQVHIHDDDVPTVTISQVTLPTGAATLEGDTWVGELGEVQPLSWVVSCSGNYEYSPLPSNPSVSGLLVQVENIRLANHPAFYGGGTGWKLGRNFLGYVSGGICDGQARTSADKYRVVGPDGGVETFKLVPKDRAPSIVAEYKEAYRQAKAAADAAGTLVTQPDIIHPVSVRLPHSLLINCSDEPRYCPQYRVGTPHTIRLTLVNRDPTILIKAESTTVDEGQAARFIVERLWHEDLLRGIVPDSETVVALRASQNGQYITGVLPTEITFGQNETSKIIELATVDDAAFGENGSVTIELLPDTTGADLNIAGKYDTSEHWAGHTPEGARSDRATIAITNNDTKPGITIAPASAPEGDTGSADMTFTVTLAKAVTEAVTINYATSDGTAIAGQDYTAVSNGSVTIAAGNTTAEFTVSVTGDQTDEPNETFNVTISMPEPEPDLNGGGSGEPVAAIIGGDTAAVTGTIIDDDPATVTIRTTTAKIGEGQDAVFTLTRSGVTSEEMEVSFMLRGSGRQEVLNATFAPGSITTRASHTTVDDAFVNYPPERDYQAVLLGDSFGSGNVKDSVWTPGNPSSATVTVTDNDELVIVTVHPEQALAREGEPIRAIFRRTGGDISQPLAIKYRRFVQRNHAQTEFFIFQDITFLAGDDEVTRRDLIVALPGNSYVDPAPGSGELYIPFTMTTVIYGDGGPNGFHRLWRAGIPNTAATVLYDDDKTAGLELHAQYSHRAAIGDQVSIEFTVINTGTVNTGDQISITSVQRDEGDRSMDLQAESRVGCTIASAIKPGESESCTATFAVRQADLDSTPLELDATATDGTASSKPFRIYIKILDGIVVGFQESANLELTEGIDSTADLVVIREGFLEEEVQVAYITRPFEGIWNSGTATAGEDYADRSDTPGVITFKKNKTEATISFDIIADELREPRERFEVVLQQPVGVKLPADKSIRRIRINENSLVNYGPRATLHLNEDGTVTEDSGSVEFVVRLNYASVEPLRYLVSLDSGAGAAVPGVDFVDPGTVTVALAPGQQEKTFTVALLDDDEVEDPENFRLSMTRHYGNPSWARLGTTTEATVTIVDDDRVKPSEVRLTLTFNERTFERVNESANRRDITVTASFHADTPVGTSRTLDPLDEDTTVRVQFDPGSTADLLDFQAFTILDSTQDLIDFQASEVLEVLIPAGQTSGTSTLRIRPVGDEIDEDNETVTLGGSVVAASSAENSLPVVPSSFTIIDDDTRGITISPASALIGLPLVEGGESGTYSLVLDSQPADTVVITLAGNQGGFLRLVPDTLTFTTSDWATPQTVSVMALDDGIAGGAPPTNLVTHQVSGGDYGSVTAPDISVNITDTTKAFVYLESGQASESDGYVEFTVTVRPILRTTPVLVRYATVDGTAIAGSDYTREVETGQTYKILNIPAGQSSATIRIPIIDNQVYESADETFTLQLTNHNNKATLDGGATSLTATGAIVDDDPTPVVSVAGPAGEVSYVSENAKDPVTFTLTLVGQSAGDVTVDYATGEAGLMDLFTARQGLAGATEGQDYAGASGTVTFTPGQTTKTVTVQVTDDDVNEETEFFGFTISTPQGADLRGQRSEDVADVGLLDDDPRGVAIGPTSIGLNEPASGEIAVAGAYTVKLSSSPTDTVTVTIGGSDPAVSLSGDTLTNNQLTFTTTNWNTAQTITVTPVKDDNAAGETVTLTHTVSGGDYAGIAADSVTVSLTDSDTRNLVLSEESLAVTEGDATGVSYTVKLATQPSDTVTVTISGHDGADLTLSGTTLTNNQLTFTTTNWGTAQTVTVKPGDDDDTDDESETLAHTASGGDYVNITKDLPVSITDDGDPQVTFVPDTFTREVNENTGANQNVGNPVTATYTGICTLTYALGGADDDSFEIDSSTGQIKTRSGVTYDHEAKSTYTVTVTASDANCGADDATVTINVNDVNEPPSVPLEVVAHAVPRTYDQLFVRWTPPGNAGRPEITGYDIQYDFGDRGNWRNGPQNVDGTSGIVSRLQHGGYYYVQVRAKNDEGSSPWSEPYFVITNVLDFEVEVSSAIVPDGLVPGDSFHLLFVTSPVQALRTKVQDYSDTVASPVITLPQSNDLLVFWQFFRPVVSARHIDARVTTNTTYTNEDKGVPVYWVGGGKAADDYEDFYDGDWDDESARNVRGELVPLPDGVWTGSTADGRELIDGGTSRALGESMAGYGAPGSTTTGEGPIYSGSTAANTERKPIFSLSSVFRVVNPPLATNEGQMSDTDDRRSAMRSQAFTTGSNRYGYELSGVALGKYYKETTLIELSIYSVDTNGHPETLLFAFTNPDSYTNDTQAFNAPAGSTLDPGATYAVVVQHATSGDDLNLYTTASDNEDDESLDGWSIADAFHYGSGGSWQAEADGKALKIIVRGIAKAGTSLAPTGLTATAVGRDRIDLSWTAPTDDGGSAITGYRIESSADGSAGWADLVADTGSDATTYSHTGLMPNTTLYYRVSAINGEGASDPSGAANATTADNPAVTVSFEQAAYTVAEGGTQSVTVTLSADPERRVVIPITATPQGTTTTDDYSVAPTSVTFDAGDMSKTITFTATQDNLDDGGESVKLTFGMLPSRVSAGTTATTTVSITDDDTPPTAVNGTVTTDEDTSYTFEADEFGYADTDNNPLGSVKVIELPATGALTLNGTAITSADLPKTVTAAELTGGGLKYAPPANANGTGYASFKFKVNDGTADSASEYFMTINVTAVNDPATGVPTIRGTAQVGQTLTASTAGIVDPDGVPSVFTYQWKRYAADRITFEADIGTDSMTYTLTESEEGKKVRVEVKFTDDDGSSEGPLISALYPSTQSQTVNPNNRPAASDGTVTTDEDTTYTFEAADFSYSDTDNNPLASVKVIELPATGALTLNGTAITSVVLPKTVTATELTGGGLKYAPPTNANGTGYASFKFKLNDGTEDSASEYFMTINVTAVNDPATGAPTIRGTAQVGQMLTASTGDIADADGVPSVFTYQWKRYAADRITFEADIGTDSMTYTLTESEEGKKVRVEVKFTDDDGSNEGPLVSALYPSTQSQTVNPNNSPTALDGTVATDEDTTYTFEAADFSYSDTDNNPLASVKVIELPATGALTLNGTAITSVVLPKTVTATELTGGGLKYAPPTNANGTGYASFKFKLNDGTEDSASEYFMTIDVTAVNDPATGAPTISGTVHVGLTLTASTAGIDDVDGLPSAFTYQWKRVDADGTSNPTEIGADSIAYTLTAAEEGKKVLVEVKFTDDDGSSEGPLASAAYPSSGTVVNLTVSFGETTYMVTENGTISVIVHLSADPERTVAIPITATPQDSASSADYTVPTSVTFNTGQMSQTITFEAIQDGVDDDGESVLLGFGTLPPGVSAGTTATTTVSITDDDEAGVTIEPTTLSVVAGRSNEYTAALATEPTGEVTVTVSGHAGTAVTTDKTTLTFTVDNWDTAQTVTVSATRNAATAKVTLAHTVAGADYGSVTAEPVVVSVVGVAGQQPTLQVGVSELTQTLTVPEGGANWYTLVLGSRPTGDVAVGVTLPAGTDLTLNKTTLTFTSTNWDTAQTVTVTAAEDDDGVTDAEVTLTHTVSGGGYGSTTVPDVEVSITENDTAGIVISMDSLTVGEEDAAGSSYTVALATQPSDTVTVTISGHDGTDLSLSGTTLSSNMLTFTVGNWNTAQTVTVTAGQDADGANDTATLTHTASGGDYASVSNTLPVTVTDDDTAAVVLSETGVTVTEGYSAGSSYTVKLATQPTGEVTVTVSGHAGTDLSLDKTTLTFTAGNWNTAQTVTVTAGQDDDAVNDTATLTHTASGGDYASVSNTLPVAVTDDDEAGVTIEPTTLSVVADRSNEYTAALATEPTGEVTVTVSGHAGTAVTTDKTTLTFTVDNWDTAQTVTVTAAEDDDGVTDAEVTLTHTVSGGGYGSTTVPDVEVSITENDTAGIVISMDSLTVGEEDAAGSSYTVALATQPSGSVSVSITGHASTDLSLDKTTLTFTAGNWNTAQTVTVTAGQDADGANDTATLTHTASGGDYASIIAELPVTVTDDDSAAIVLSETDLTVTEGYSAGSSYTVKLATQPTGEVTVTVSGHAGTDLTLDKTTLTFTTTNWATAQTVTVKAGDDDNADNESDTLAHAANGGDYVNVTKDLPVSITDDEVPVTVSFGQANYTVAEGDPVSVTVTLSADPERTVVIPLTATPQDGAAPADYTVPQSVTFNTGQMSQTITFTAAQDEVDDDGESVLLAFGAPLPGGVSLGTTVATTVSITDDDGAGVSVSEASLTIAEGSSGTYTIVLDSQPTADVTVTINAPSNTDVTAEPASLTFSSTDWNSPKTVTVNAAQDADADDETATVTHAVTSTDSIYSGAPANSVTVTITDDEVPVTVSFGQANYTVAEGDPVSVTVTLSADPERTVVIPLTATPQDGAAPADYTVPQSVTFNTGQMSQTITFTATQDDVDDDGESVLLAFGTLPPAVSLGTTTQTTVSITDDDVPAVTASFDRASYRVLEGDTVTVGVTLSGDPERTVEVPLTATDYGGASSEDYSGVPSSVTINAGETSKTFEFMAMADDASDTGESVMIGFGTSLPSRVTEGTPNEARVTINQMSTQFSLDCSLTATVWCADLGFSDRVAENYGWLYMRYGHGWDPPSSLSDDDFRFRGVDYDVRSMELLAGTHPVMPNAWSTWQQGYSSFRIGIYWDHRWGAPSEEHYRDWVLHLDGLELPFKDALRHGSDFVWVGAEFQQVFNDWTPSTVTKIGIKEVAAADQDTNPLLPWAPMQVDAWPEGPDRLLIVWAKPASFYPGLPDPTSYTVQWKLASADWSDSAAVSQLEVAATSNFQAVIMNGMTEDAVYSVRVIASNDAGDGPPSEETLGRPQDSLPRLIARTVNRQTLNLRFSEQLDPNAVPAATNFVVKADGGLIMVDSVAISGDEVILTLHHAVTAATHSVLVRYDKPTDPSAVFLQDTNGNYANIRQHHELLEVVNITPQSSVQPLTAQFTNMPSSHDGRTRFTFDIEFSEPVWIGDGLARDDMLEITGGTVFSAPWKDRRTDKFIVHVRPDTQGDIVIVLPGHRACHGIVGSYQEVPDPVAGAPCAIGSRVLTNEPTVTIPGPSSPAQQVVENTPAEGEPQIRACSH